MPTTASTLDAVWDLRTMLQDRVTVYVTHAWLPVELSVELRVELTLRAQEAWMMQKQQVRYCVSEYIDPFPSCSSNMKMKHGCKMYTEWHYIHFDIQCYGSQG